MSHQTGSSENHHRLQSAGDWRGYVSSHPKNHWTLLLSGFDSLFAGFDLDLQFPPGTWDLILRVHKMNHKSPILFLSPKSRQPPKPLEAVVPRSISGRQRERERRPLEAIKVRFRSLGPMGLWWSCKVKILPTWSLTVRPYQPAFLKMSFQTSRLVGYVSSLEGTSRIHIFTDLHWYPIKIDHLQKETYQSHGSLRCVCSFKLE